MAQGVPEELVEQRPGVLGPGVGDLSLLLEEGLDAAGGDLAERVGLEEGSDMDAEVVAVVLLRSLGDLATFEIAQPELRKDCAG